MRQTSKRKELAIDTRFFDYQNSGQGIGTYQRQKLRSNLKDKITTIRAKKNEAVMRIQNSLKSIIIKIQYNILFQMQNSSVHAASTTPQFDQQRIIGKDQSILISQSYSFSSRPKSRLIQKTNDITGFHQQTPQNSKQFRKAQVKLDSAKTFNQIKKIQKQLGIIKQAISTIQDLTSNVKSMCINENIQISQQAHRFQIQKLEPQIDNLKQQCRRLNYRQMSQNSQEALNLSINHLKIANQIKKRIVKSSFEDKQVIEGVNINKKKRLIVVDSQEFLTPPKKNAKRVKTQPLQATFKKKKQKLIAQHEQQTLVKSKVNINPSGQKLKAHHSNFLLINQKNSLLVNNTIKVFNGRSIKQRCFGNYRKLRPYSSSQQKQFKKFSMKSPQDRTCKECNLFN